MPFTLDYLNQLTHKQIDTAIEYLCTKYNLPCNPPEVFTCTPYLRLFDLINPVGKSDNTLAFNLKVLAKLSGGAENELGWLNTHSVCVIATRIFLKFKTQGDAYQSDHGNNNTCLHDAVIDSVWHTAELTQLLIQHGANPTLKNDEDVTAAVLYMKCLLPEESKLFSWEYSSPKTSLRRKLLKFVAWIMDSYPPATTAALSGLVLYFPPNRYPTLLDFRPKIANDYKLLHEAVGKNLVDVVQCLLEQGANPNVLADGETKPIHIALDRLRRGQGTNDCLNIIAHLLAYELMQSIPQNASLSPERVINAILALGIDKVLHKKHIAQMLYTIECLQPLFFTMEELLIALDRESYHLAHYEITMNFSSKIGEGTFGNVYKGSTQSGEVAVKLGNRPSNLHKMREEAELLSQLNHPNIIRFICTIERGRFGYVMPYAAGGCLEVFIHTQTKPLSAQCLYSFSKQLNEGLRYLHNQGYVHLDLKPANILLDNAQDPEASTLLLADFGATSKIGKTYMHPVTTVSFCSPEGFDYKCPYAITHDTYSYGLCLGYLATGIHPWIELGKDFDNPSAIAKQVRAGKRTTFDEKPMSPKLAHLVNWCWKQAPSERPSHDNIDDYVDFLLHPMSKG